MATRRSPSSPSTPSTSSRRTPKVTGGELAPTGRVATRSDAADSTLPVGRMPVLRVVPMPADANPYGDIFGG